MERGEDYLHERRKYRKKRWCLTLKKNLAYFSLVFTLNWNCPIDLLCKSVGWFLYNGNTGLKGKVDVGLMKTVRKSMLIFRYMFFFQRQLHFSFQSQLLRAKLWFHEVARCNILIYYDFNLTLVVAGSFLFILWRHF